MSGPIPDWFRAAILNGLQALYVLRLPDTPAADALGPAAEVWLAALWAARPWEEARDRPRLSAAFLALAARATAWPAPAAVLAALPRLPEPRALPAPPISPEVAEANRARVSGLIALCLRATLPGPRRPGPAPDPEPDPAPEPPPAPDPLARRRLARELEAHGVPRRITRGRHG